MLLHYIKVSSLCQQTLTRAFHSTIITRQSGEEISIIITQIRSTSCRRRLPAAKTSERRSLFHAAGARRGGAVGRLFPCEPFDNFNRSPAMPVRKTSAMTWVQPWMKYVPPSPVQRFLRAFCAWRRNSSAPLGAQSRRPAAGRRRVRSRPLPPPGVVDDGGLAIPFHQ